jgi:hypothetical protein
MRPGPRSTPAQAPIGVVDHGTKASSPHHLHGSDPTSIARRSTALAAPQKANPGLKISLTLPLLPECLTGDGG